MFILGNAFSVQIIADGPGTDVRHQRRHVCTNGAMVGLAVRQSITAEIGHTAGLHRAHDRLQSHRPRTVPEHADVSPSGFCCCFQTSFNLNRYNNMSI